MKLPVGLLAIVWAILSYGVPGAACAQNAGGAGWAGPSPEAKYAGEEATLAKAYATLPVFAAGVFAVFILSLVGVTFLRRRRGNPISELRRHSWIVSILFVTAVFVISNHLHIRGIAAPVWDADAQGFPYYVLVSDAIRSGHLLPWDLWSNAGVAIMGDPQVGALSPLTLAIAFIAGPTAKGFIFYWLLMWWLGGLGIFLLGRHLGAPAWGSCAIALGYLFCGLYTGNAEHISWVSSFSFLPLIVWRLDAALLTRRYVPALQAGALWGVSSLAGYPGFTLLTGCFCVLWASGRMVSRDRPALRFAVGSLLTFGIAGILVMSPAFYAFLHDGAGTNTRTGVIERDEAILGSLSPSTLSTFASAYIPLLKFYRDDIWPHTDESMCTIYCGAVASVFALFALFGGLRDRRRLGLALLGAFAIACTLGYNLPLRLWLYDWFYPMKFIRYAGLFRAYYLFPVFVLALLGTRDLHRAMNSRDRKGPWPRFAIASASIGGAAVLVFILFAKSDWSATVPRKILAAGAIQILAWAAVAAIALLAWKTGEGRFRRYYLPLLLIFIAGFDAFMTSVLSVPTMARVQNREHWRVLDAKHSTRLGLDGMNRIESSCYPGPPCSFLKNDQMITKTPAFNAYTTEANRFHLAMVSNPLLRSMATGPGRIWFSPQVVEVPVSAGMFNEFVRRSDSLGVAPLVIHSGRQMLSPKLDLRRDTLPLSRNRAANGPLLLPVSASELASSAGIESQIAVLPPAIRLPANVSVYNPRMLEFTVECPRDGWLLVTDRWARGWRAQVNGTPVDVFGANFIFRGIPVHAGSNTVRFVYGFVGTLSLLYVSWAILLAVVVLSFKPPAMPRPVE